MILVANKEQNIKDKKQEITSIEKYRPVYHYTPKKNWMNDPNGMVYFDGEYHLCYQHDNYNKVFSDMSWGHAISTDLVHWEECVKAIAPDNDGLGMIFSGSTVVDKSNCSGFGVNTLVAFYTSTKPRQQQSMAYSIDKGRKWSNVENKAIVIGWMSNWDYADKVPTNNWRGTMTIPREIELKDIDGEILVASKPACALEKIIGASIATIDNVKINSNINVGEELSSSRIKIKMDICDIKDVGMEIGNSKGQNVKIGYNKQDAYFYVDRSNAGENSFKSGFAKIHKAKVIRKLKMLDMEIFMDKSSVEVFFNNGERVMTEIIFPTEDFNMVKIFCDNKIEIREFDIKRISMI